jgi:hypothetical protein
MNGANTVWADDGTATSSMEVYDGGIKLSDAGLGKVAPATYLNADSAPYTFTVENFDITQFDTLGVRATSTSTAEGSIKWVDDTPYDPPPPDEPVSFDGLSQGAWKSFDKGAGDWDETSFTTGMSYDDVFGVDATGDLTLLQAISNNGGGEAALERQAVAALLNSDSTGESTLTADYRFSTADVIAAVQEVYDDSGFDATQAADLADLLEFWNTAPENNTGVGAHVDGELHSDDTTVIATTLEWNGHDGGSFAGNIFQVLDTLHPTHDWL